MSEGVVAGVIEIVVDGIFDLGRLIKWSRDAERPLRISERSVGRSVL